MKKSKWLVVPRQPSATELVGNHSSVGIRVPDLATMGTAMRERDVSCRVARSVILVITTVSDLVIIQSRVRNVPNEFG